MSAIEKILAGEHVEFPMDDNAGARKTAFADVFMDLLSKKGYSNPRSLKIRGAYAFLVDCPGPTGGTKRIGLKTAYNGWLNTSFKMGPRIDEVWIATVKWDGDNNAVAFEVYEMPAKDLIGIYDRIHEARRKLKRQEDHTYLPMLDSARTEHLKSYPKAYNCAEGAIEDYADLIYSAPLVWANRVKYGIIPAEEGDGAPVQQKEIEVLTDPLQGLEDPIAALKQLIAKRNNTTPDKVEVLVRC